MTELGNVLEQLSSRRTRATQTALGRECTAQLGHAVLTAPASITWPWTRRNTTTSRRRTPAWSRNCRRTNASASGPCFRGSPCLQFMSRCGQVVRKAGRRVPSAAGQPPHGHRGVLRKQREAPGLARAVAVKTERRRQKNAAMKDTRLLQVCLDASTHLAPHGRVPASSAQALSLGHTQKESPGRADSRGTHASCSSLLPAIIGVELSLGSASYVSSPSVTTPDSQHCFRSQPGKIGDAAHCTRPPCHDSARLK